VASLLGLPYPGGPSIQRAAEQGNAKAYRFPRPLLDDDTRLDFSFSGLKTAVRYLVVGTGKLGAAEGRGATQRVPGEQREISVADVAASFQAAVIDCLVGKAELSLHKTGYSTLCVGGGVAANKPFRERLEQSAAEHGYEVHVPPLSLCTDNAVMGAIAIERLRAGKVEDLSLDVYPGLERTPANH
jgi:N6-L-threonylcarbamoyladenine synthase